MQNSFYFKKVLFIAYFFPPCGGGGVQRSLKFVKYLPKFKWKPYVLTVRDRNMVQDYSLMEDIPSEARIFEIFSPEYFFFNAKRDFSKQKPLDQIYKFSIVAIIDKLSIFLKYIVNQYLFQPDSALLWFPFAVVKGIKIIREYGIDLIYATGSPWTDLLIGATLKFFTRKPFVIDLRDPWSLNEKSKALDKLYERFVFACSDAIIMNNETLLNEYAAKYPVFSNKMKVITNGFDKEDFKETHTIKNDQTMFRIVYAGRYQSPLTFLTALNDLLELRPILKERLELIFIGYESRPTGICDGLKNIVKFIPYKEHRKLLSYLMCANLLLLILEPGLNNKRATTGKIYEYIACNKPILAVVPLGNPLFELIPSTGTGSVVEYNNIRGLTRSLLAFIEDQSNFQPRPDIISKYERRHLTACLAEVFANCIKSL